MVTKPKQAKSSVNGAFCCYEFMRISRGRGYQSLLGFKVDIARFDVLCVFFGGVGVGAMQHFVISGPTALQFGPPSQRYAA